MMDIWKSFLLERAAEWGLSAGGEWECIFYNNYHAHHSNITLLWFYDRGPFPVLITKLFRDPAIPRREFANLRRAYKRASDWIPRPLYFGAEGDFWMLWMHGVPGRRPHRISGTTLESLGNTVTALHRAMANAHGGLQLSDRHSRAVAQPLAALEAFGNAASVHEGCARLTEEASESWMNSLAVIPQHGDLYLDNVLANGRDWYFIDWESFGAIDLPFYDLLTVTYSVLRTGGGTPEDWEPRLVREVPRIVRKYAHELQLPTAALRVLLPLVFINWFHVQWCDGREAFARHMYATIRHYFEHPKAWEKALIGDV